MKLKILHLEDAPDDAEFVERALLKGHLSFETLVVSNKEGFIKGINEYKPDIVLSDHSLPSFNSYEALSIFKEHNLNIPFILITATISEDFAVDIMKRGADDYILKDRLERLPNALQSALDKFRLARERDKMLVDILQRNKELEQFSYIISHNLRSPVANIAGLANELSRDNLSDVEVSELSKHLVESANQLDTVIIDLNKILQIKQEINEVKEEVTLSELVNDVLKSMKGVMTDEKITITMKFAAESKIVTVKSYLYSIFYNLISNSIKYGAAHRVVKLKITAERVGDTLFVYFKDNGLGIDLKRHGDQLFGLYKRFHTHVEGKGMGLFMVKTQVESLGGEISVKSKVNVGTTFKIGFNCD